MTLPKDASTIRSHETFKDDPDDKRVKWFISKIGQTAFVTEIEGWFDTYKGYFEDGEKFTVTC